MRLIFVSSVFLLLSFMLWSQSDLLDTGGSIDDLLGGTDDPIEDQNVDVDSKPGKQKSIIDELIDSKSLSLRLASVVSMGYTPGWDDIPLTSSTFHDSPILELDSVLVLDYIVSREMRVYQKWYVQSPQFELALDEAFVDYYPSDLLSVRAGRFDEKWGESVNFSHTNLINRVPDNFGNKTIFAAKSTMPWKTGYIEALALTRKGFCDDFSSPGMDEIGWGLRINPPINGADITAAVFAHPQMNLRSTLSVKTTLFGSLEAYGESLVAVDKDFLNGGDVSDNVTSDGRVDNPIDFSVNLGIYKEFINNKLSIGMEYLYNGEETELELASGDWDLYYGNNGAVYTKWKGDGWDISLYGRYSFYEKSGIVGPAFSWNINDIAKLQIGGAWAWGNGAYDEVNPDDLGRAVPLFMRLKLNGSWETTL